MKLMVNDNCCVCSNCSKVCPVGAPFYDGEKIAIDQDKCLHCGSCMRACRLGAIYDADAPADVPAAHEPIVYDADFCVLGHGAAGMIAAARAAEAGKKVVLLEKGKGVSGSTPYATGLFMHDSRWEKEAGLPEKMQAKIDEATRETEGKLDPALIDRVMHGLPEFFDWCCEWARPEDYFAVRRNPFGEMTVDVHDSEHGAGIFVADRFPGRLKELGVQVLTYTAAKDFVLGGGRITAVKAADAGGEVLVRAKDFLIATGSLIHSSEILDRVQPGYANAFTRRYGHRAYTLSGDGVAMAAHAGVPIHYDRIAIAYIGELCMPVDMQGIHFGRPIDTEMLCQIHKKEALRINRLGKRWVDESRGHKVDDAMVHQPDMASFTVMDHALLMQTPEHPMKNSPEAKAGLRMGGPAVTPGAEYDKPVDLEKLHAFAALPGGHLFIADTLAELADKMGVPADALARTVADYNAACESGSDPEFGKAAQYLRPVSQPPFYAFSTFLASDGAFGGLEVDPDMHVLGDDGPIGNLYAAGDVCSSYFILGGREGRKKITHDFTWACISGYLAGNDVARK